VEAVEFFGRIGKKIQLFKKQIGTNESIQGMIGKLFLGERYTLQVKGIVL
jgi:hypothetical protein